MRNVDPKMWGKCDGNKCHSMLKNVIKCEENVEKNVEKCWSENGGQMLSNVSRNVINCDSMSSNVG